jgi:hypothetical protein
MAVRGLLLALALAVGAGVHADEQLDEAKRAFSDAREAYARSDYPTALTLFRRSYQLSHRPALLYDIARALTELHRPGEAADALAEYERVSDGNERTELLREIERLRLAQRLLDGNPPMVKPIPRKRRWPLAVGLTVGGLALAGGAVALGLTLAPRTGPHADVGPIVSTP